MKTSDLKGWSKNPRKILEHDLERLKNQLQRLGVYKSLLVTNENVVIGGNQRLKALNELGIEEVDCNVIEFKKEGKVFIAYINGEKQSKASFATVEQGMMEYALSDNDSAGYTDETLLMDYLNKLPNIDDVPLAFYGAALMPPSNLAELVAGINPEEQKEDEQGDLDAMEKKMCVCPECNAEHEFTPLEEI